MRKKITPYAFPVVFYGVAVVLVFGRALFPSSGQLIFGDDIHHQYYFYREFFNHFLRQGIFSFWNPYNFSGFPFIANPIANIWYPATWLFFLLPLNIAYSWHIALHILWAMVGMYVLISYITRRLGKEFFGDARSYKLGSFKNSHTSLNETPPPMFKKMLKFFLGRSFSAPQNSSHRGFISSSIDLSAWVGGLLFGFSGFFMARVWAGHVDVIAAASWMPWVVWSNAKCQMINDKWKTWCAIAGVFLAMQLLAGYQTMALFTLETVFIVTLSRWLFPSRRNVGTELQHRGSRFAGFHCLAKPDPASQDFFVKSLKPFVSLIIVVVLGMGLAAIQLVPEYEFLRQSIRSYVLPYSWASYGSLVQESLKQLVHPFFFGNQLTYNGPPPNYIEHAAFVGRVGLALAVLAFLVFLLKSLKGLTYLKTKTENIWILVFTVVAIFSLWVSLGPHAPFDLQYILWRFVPVYHSLRIPPRHLILFVFGVSALAALGVQMVKIRVVQMIIAALVLVEMIGFARHFIELRPIPETRQDQELVSIFSPPRCRDAFTSGVVKSDCRPHRLLQNFGVWISQRDALEFDAAMGKGIFSATGYDVAILKSYYEFIDAAAGNRGSSILEQDVQIPYITQFTPWVDFLNIKYIMHPRAFDPLFGTKNDRFILIREDTKYDYRLYENKTVLPRFFYVSEALVVATKNDVLSKIRDGSVNPHTTVLFENAKEMLPSLSPCKIMTDPSIAIGSYTPNRIELVTNNSCDAFLVSSEVYYPGWEAYIDGKKTDIIKGNYAFRTLFVPAGKHLVSYVYRPTIFYFSAALSVFTLTILLLIVLRIRKP